MNGHADTCSCQVCVESLNNLVINGHKPGCKCPDCDVEIVFDDGALANEMIDFPVGQAPITEDDITVDDKPEHMLSSAHFQSLNRAQTELNEVDEAFAYISTLTFPELDAIDISEVVGNPESGKLTGSELRQWFVRTLLQHKRGQVPWQNSNQTKASDQNQETADNSTSGTGDSQSS